MAKRAWRLGSLWALPLLALACSGGGDVGLGGNFPPVAMTLLGAEEDDLLGRALASGDVNGDGVADLVVGAPQADGPENERRSAGEVYVLFGGDGLPSSRALAVDGVDVLIYGADRGDRLGISLAAADVNGDGLDDLIMGAIRADVPEGESASRDDAGAVYVVFGSPQLSGVVELAEGQFDFAIYGADPFDALGGTVTAGDVNGDGTSDILTGAAGADGPGNARDGAGEAYVVAGSPRLGGTLDLAVEEALLTVVGADAVDNMPTAVAAGDMNGDRISDMIIGASAGAGPDNSRPGAGEIYLLMGSRELQGVRDAGTEADLTIYGPASFAFLGETLASGDLSGDGIDDLVAGAPGFGPALPAGSVTGALLAVFGDSNLSGVTDLSVEQSDAMAFGANAGDRLGGCAFAPCSPLVVADVNADAKADLLLGASVARGSAQRDRAGTGGAYALYGPRSLESALDLGSSEPDLRLTGGREGDALGGAVAVADVDGDNSPELIVAAPDADGPDGTRLGAGEVYVFRSPALQGSDR